MKNQNKPLERGKRRRKRGRNVGAFRNGGAVAPEQKIAVWRNAEGLWILFADFLLAVVRRPADRQMGKFPLACNCVSRYAAPYVFKRKGRRLCSLRLVAKQKKRNIIYLLLICLVQLHHRFPFSFYRLLNDCRHCVPPPFSHFQKIFISDGGRAIRIFFLF